MSIVLTNASLLFPQNIGKFQKVSGWPMAMYKIQYKLETDVESTGSIVHSIVKERSQISWSKVIANIIFWTLLLDLTWIASHKIIKVKPQKRQANKV